MSNLLDLFEGKLETANEAKSNQFFKWDKNSQSQSLTGFIVRDKNGKFFETRFELFDKTTNTTRVVDTYTKGRSQVFYFLMYITKADNAEDIGKLKLVKFNKSLALALQDECQANEELDVKECNPVDEKKPISIKRTGSGLNVAYSVTIGRNSKMKLPEYETIDSIMEAITFKPKTDDSVKAAIKTFENKEEIFEKTSNAKIIKNVDEVDLFDENDF